MSLQLSGTKILKKRLSVQNVLMREHRAHVLEAFKISVVMHSPEGAGGSYGASISQ